MVNRTIVYVASLLVVVGILAASAASASARNWERTYFTFSAPVQIPGVVLPAGTYVFDRPSPTLDPTMVRVMNRTTSKLYLLALTHVVHRRSDGELKPALTLGEAIKGVPRPISVWFPKGETRGHQFIYKN
jgi:hypothetical protein